MEPMTALTAASVGIQAANAIAQPMYATGAKQFDKRMARKNYALQKDTFDWQKEMQGRTWEREDNAVQRRASDLENAGLSKTLAAGSAASASGPIQLQTPEMRQENPYKTQAEGLRRSSESIAGAMNAIQMSANINQTQKATELMDAQKNKTDAETAFMNDINPLRTDAQRIQNSINEKVDYYKRQQEMAQLNQRWSDSERQISQTQLNNQRREIEWYGIQRAELEVIRQQIENDTAELNLSNREIDYLRNQVALDLARHNLGVYKRTGMSSGSGGGWPRAMAEAGTSAAQAAGQFIEGRSNR